MGTGELIVSVTEMDDIIKFLVNNKEWLFSGVCVAIIGSTVRMIFRRKKKDQEIKAASESTNVQAGDKAKITINIQKSKDDNVTSVIKRATLEDVKKYDPKTRKLLRTLFTKNWEQIPMMRTYTVSIIVLSIFIILIVKLIWWIISLF